MPAHQMVPSCAASGSCGREPSDGATHSRKLTCTGPRMTTDFGRGYSGKVLPRYAAIVFMRSSGSLTIDEIRSFHPCSVYPHEFVMLATPWQTVHVCATASLPGASGRSATPVVLPRWPATGAITLRNIAAAARSPSEYFDISPSYG